MRTNIEIDDDTMTKAFSVSEFKTKKEVVAQALKEFVQNRTRKDPAELRGRIKFADGYDYKTMREGKI